MRTNVQMSKHTEAKTRCDRENLTASKFRSRHGSCLKRRHQSKNLVWSLHLTTILLSNGRSAAVLTIFDEETQKCLRSLAAHHIVIENVLDALFNAFLHIGIPEHLVSLDDSSLISNAIRQWLGELELSCTLLESREYKENTCGILLKDKLVKDLLHEKSFASVVDLQLWLTNWRAEHNRLINLVRT